MPAKLATIAMALSMVMTGTGLTQAASCTPPGDSGISKADQGRVEGLLESRSQGLAAALVWPEAADRKIVSDFYAKGLSVVDTVPAGDYRCRTIKMGGGVPLTIYGFFACEVDEAADGHQAILKTSGSQRFSGTLTPSVGGLFYIGALNYADEDPIAYGVNAERDQVGCLYRSGDSYVLELPSPQVESVHDVIELVAAE